MQHLRPKRKSGRRKMKLRNKKTGEIVDYNPTLERWNGPSKEIKHYNSLAELNEEWEDYEEPKEYWYYDTTKNGVEKITHLEDKEKDQEIGNYFETKEEAEKAVEQLKAWKRLKDKGFRFKFFEETDRGYIGDFTIYAHIEPNYSQKYDELDDDLGLLFGGEE